MCIHPEIQVAAQAELDSVVGRERLPTMADRPSLPYINAILKEVSAIFLLRFEMLTMPGFEMGTCCPDW